MDEVCDVICLNETYVLIFTNHKASKILEIYKKIVLQVKNRMQEHQQGFEYSAEQPGTNFKSCLAACKKASMTRRNGSGIKHLMQKQPAWFQKLFVYEYIINTLSMLLTQIGNK